jgi:hypothetical protein
MKGTAKETKKVLDFFSEIMHIRRKWNNIFKKPRETINLGFYTQ